MDKSTFPLQFFPRGRTLPWLVGTFALLAALCLTVLTFADEPSVSIEKQAEPDATIADESIDYTVVFANDEDAEIALMVISDSLPANFTFQTMLAGSDITENPTGTTGDIHWTGPYTIAAHGSLDLVYKVDAQAPPSFVPYQNRVQARLSTGEVISDSAAVVILGVQMDGVKLASPSSVYKGETVDYTVALTNSGSLDAVLDVISDTLPTGAVFSHMVGSPLPAPTVVDGVLQWIGPLTVPTNGELRFTYRVTMTEGGRGLDNRVEARYGDTVVGPIEAEVDVLLDTASVFLPTVLRNYGITPPPSESLLAFDSKQTDDFEIFVINPNGTGLQNVSNLAGGDLAPNWSGDGTKIAWVHYYEGRGDILSATPDGGQLSNLTNHPKDDRSPAWSPDGTKIAFTSFRDGRWEVYVMAANGSNQTRLTSRLCQSHSPAWSPDSTRIAFLCGLDEYAEVFVMNADGTNQVRLTSDDLEATALDWSPDNARIAFVLNDKKTDSEIYVVNANTGVLTRLTDNASYDFAPKWSPDGSLIAFSTNRTGNYEIFTMNPNGTNPVNLTNAAGADYVPAWSADGTLISFISTRDGNKELYVMGADGSGQLRLTHTAEDEAVHVWQP